MKPIGKSCIKLKIYLKFTKCYFIVTSFSQVDDTDLRNIIYILYLKCRQVLCYQKVVMKPTGTQNMGKGFLSKR